MSTETSSKLREIRQRARTDLFFLATELLGLDLVEEVHRPVCEFFVKKDSSIDLYKQDVVKNRLLLDPRGHFKTSIDEVDIVQWIINFPDVRILVLSGTRELVARIIDNVRKHFLLNEKFRSVFPEFALSEKTKGSVNEFTTPMRKNHLLREPTLTGSTLESVKAGSHYDIIKGDDIVNETNVSSPELVQKVIDQYNATTPLLDRPDGYKDLIGTRYDFSDLYGWVIDNDASSSWKVFKRAAIELPMRPESKVLFEKDRKGRERFSYTLLKRIQDEDPRMFSCQYLNEPKMTDSEEFTESAVRSAFVPMRLIPLVVRQPMSNVTAMGGRLFQTWDLAYTDNEKSKWSVGCTGLWDYTGRLWVVDYRRGRWNPFELAYNIVSFALEWKQFLSRVGIEMAGASHFLEPTIQNMCRSANFHMPIDWIKVSRRKSKESKVFALQPFLLSGRLKFSDEIKIKDQVVKEFVRFPYYRFNDIPDATSMLLFYRSNVDTIPELMQPSTISYEVSQVPGCEGICAGLVG